MLSQQHSPDPLGFFGFVLLVESLIAVLLTGSAEDDWVDSFSF